MAVQTARIPRWAGDPAYRALIVAAIVLARLAWALRPSTAVGTRSREPLDRAA